MTLNVVVVDVELMDAEVGRDAVKCDDPRRAKSGTRTFSVSPVVVVVVFTGTETVGA